MKATVVFKKNWTAFNDGKRYIVNSGSSRSSKTFSLLQIFWLIAWIIPNTKLAVFRFTKKDCKDTILQDMLKYYPTIQGWDNVVFNKSESYFTFKNGSQIFIEGTDDDLKVHGYHSDILWFNEFYKMGKDTFDQLDMRCSKAVFMDYNPIGRSWADDIIKQDNAILIHSTFKDNPFVPLQQKIKILSYDPSNPENVKNKTASDYKWKVYGLGLKAEKPNRIFTNWGEMLDIQFDALPYPTYYGVDFGQSAPTTLIAMKTDGDKSFFFKELLYKPMNEIPCMLHELFEQMKISKNTEMICDSGNELNKDQINKLNIAGFCAIPAKKGQGSVKFGRELLQKKNILFTESSHNIRDEYENHSWRIVNDVQLDEPEQGADHAIDAMIYVCHWYCHTRGLL